MRALASHNSNFTLFYHSKIPLYHYTIPFYNTSSIPNFYFPILLIKIIYLHYKIIFIRNKIIYPQSPSFFPFNNHKFYRKHRHHMPNVDHQTPHQSPKKKTPDHQTPITDHPNTTCPTPITKHHTDHPKKKPRPSNTKHQSPKHHMPNADHQTPHRSPITQKKKKNPPAKIHSPTPITQTPITHANPNPWQTHNPTLISTPHPNPHQSEPTQPMANPQPNTNLHTTPKHRSLCQTPNADLHSTTLIWSFGGYGILESEARE